MGIVGPRRTTLPELDQEGFSDADDEDLLLLLDDLLSIRDPAVALPTSQPDARRRRLTALSSAPHLARRIRGLRVEDAHWIDDVSESMLAEFLTVIPHMPSLVLISSRPEYRGAFDDVSGGQLIALRPLNRPCRDPRHRPAGQAIDRSLIWPLSVHTRRRKSLLRRGDRPRSGRAGCSHGNARGYTLSGDADDWDVPATLQATIGARIDRLGSSAKDTLNAAAVIGSHFDTELVANSSKTPISQHLSTQNWSTRYGSVSGRSMCSDIH